MPIHDYAVRLAAFEWLEKQIAIHGEILSRNPLLTEGFVFHGKRVPLVSPQGIFKPQVCELPLSISTTPEGPYEDSSLDNGLLAYKYRGSINDIEHRDNVGLRRAMETQTPLIYFIGVAPNQYKALWPVYIVGDDSNSLTFTVAMDDTISISDRQHPRLKPEGLEARREYITVLAKKRVHQAKFRAIVLDAYQERCALCQLKHANLLDAAHIIEDTHSEGIAHVSNGIALCKLHHAAYDSEMVGISPDYQAHVRKDIMEETDGPMLKYGLQGVNGINLIKPRHKELWPDRDKLNIRFERFLRAA